MPPGFTSQIEKKKPARFSYINTDGHELLHLPRSILVGLLVFIGFLCSVPLLILTSRQNSLSIQVSESESRQQKAWDDVKAYQSVTYAQCKAAAALAGKSTEEEK